MYQSTIMSAIAAAMADSSWSDGGRSDPKGPPQKEEIDDWVRAGWRSGA